jgi:hypothetical protein
MKKFVLSIGLFFSISALASNERIECNITEFGDGQQIKSTLTVNAENDPHGSLLTFKGNLFPEISGFVSLLQHENNFFAVLSIYSDKLSTNSSGQYQMVANNQLAQLQYIIPSDSLQLAGVEILCRFFKN